jgi:hypothetical protein
VVGIRREVPHVAEDVAPAAHDRVVLARAEVLLCRALRQRSAAPRVLEGEVPLVLVFADRGHDELWVAAGDTDLPERPAIAAATIVGPQADLRHVRATAVVTAAAGARCLEIRSGPARFGRLGARTGGDVPWTPEARAVAGRLVRALVAP